MTQNCLHSRRLRYFGGTPAYPLRGTNERAYGAALPAKDTSCISGASRYALMPTKSCRFGEAAVNRFTDCLLQYCTVCNIGVCSRYAFFLYRATDGRCEWWFGQNCLHSRRLRYFGGAPAYPLRGTNERAYSTALPAKDTPKSIWCRI